ncbi:hypothetical protein [Alteromonas sediminis]|nr:hypothetical protein [Alteromonas sediminis]
MNSIGRFNAKEACRAHDDIYDDGILDGDDPNYPLDPNLIHDGWYFPEGNGERYGPAYRLGDELPRSEADTMFLDTMRANNPGIWGQTFSFFYYSLVYFFGWLFWYE